jgi:folate-dependent phosphoribosylglycinamide formyltransferase PurN
MAPQRTLHTFAPRISQPAPLGNAPLNLAVITSLRDIHREDRNGQMLDGNAYMMGVPEAIVHAINGDRERLLAWTQGVSRHHRHIIGPDQFDAMERRILQIGDEIRQRFRVVGLIHDDAEHDLHPRRGNPFPLRPEEGDWILPTDLRAANGELLTSNTVHIPSTFRGLPLRQRDERAAQKSEFERQIHQVGIEQMDADVLLSDHLMVILRDLLQEPADLRGRLLNIHPAITDRDDSDCFRGDTPTADAISAAQAREVHTGSTFHFIDEGIDTGPPIARLKPTPVLRTDAPQQLRHRNYLTKVLVAFEGLVHYYDRLYSTFRPGDGQELTRSTHDLPLSLT